MMIQTVGAVFAAVKTLLQEERVTTHQSLMRKSEGCHQEDSIFIAIRKFLSSHRFPYLRKPFNILRNGGGYIAFCISIKTKRNDMFQTISYFLQQFIDVSLCYNPIFILHFLLFLAPCIYQTPAPSTPPISPLKTFLSPTSPLKQSLIYSLPRKREGPLVKASKSILASSEHLSSGYCSSNTPVPSSDYLMPVSTETMVNVQYRFYHYAILQKIVLLQRF